MTSTMTKRIASAAAVLVLLLCGCNSPELHSKWRDREITIDGTDSEWEDCRLYYDEETRTALGVYNDDRHIYIALATGDRMLQRKIFGLGMHTWFNLVGNKDRDLGILFPTGLMGKYIPGEREFGRRTGKGGSFGSGREPSGGAADQWVPLEMESPDLEIHIPEKGYENNILLEEAGAYGFEAQVRHQGDRLVYELKLPLIENGFMPDLVVGAGTGRIGIGFMTKAFDRTAMKGTAGERGPTGRQRGGRGGGMGGPGGGMGGLGGGKGGPGKGVRDMGQAYELWIKVALAERPD